MTSEGALFYKIVRVSGEGAADAMVSKVRNVVREGTQVYGFPFEGGWHVTVIGKTPDKPQEVGVEDIMLTGMSPTASAKKLEQLKERQVFAHPRR